MSSSSSISLASKIEHGQFIIIKKNRSSSVNLGKEIQHPVADHHHRYDPQAASFIVLNKSSSHLKLAAPIFPVKNYYHKLFSSLPTGGVYIILHEINHSRILATMMMMKVIRRVI
jgi:hypothetical protein